MVVLALLALGQLVSVWHADAHYCRADSRGALLVAQAIVEKGTPRLDAYGDAVGRLGYRLVQKDGHVYYYFPLGTSLVMMPAVWVANGLGLDMATEQDDIHLQKILSGVLLGLVTILIYALSRLYLGPVASLALAAIFGSCTTLTSTIGSALWSHDASIVFVLLGVLILGKIYSGGGRQLVLAGLLGFSVVIAWLCRPTAAIFALTVAAFLAPTRPRLLIPFGSVIAVVGAVFVVWSWRELHQMLPDYYLPGRLGGTRRFGEALLGHLLSPSRGLFVLSPVLLGTVGGIILHRRCVLREPLARMSVVWIVVFWLTISWFPHWWGGHCFGSRLLADTLPAWALLTILVWRQVAIGKQGLVKSIITGLWAAAAVWGFHVNTIKGLHEEATVRWNERPDIDTHPDLLFDWRYPQFLATKSSLDRRELRTWIAGAEPYRIGTAIDIGGSNAVLAGFNAVEGRGETAFRWTEGRSARVHLKAATDPARSQLELELRCAFFGSQRVAVHVNGTAIGEIEGRAFPPTYRALAVPESAWLRGQKRGHHEIELQMPGAQTASNTDRRVLGVALYSLRFNVAR